MVMIAGENLTLDALKEMMAKDKEFSKEGWSVSGRVPCGKLNTAQDRRCVLSWKGFPLHKTTSNYLMWEAMSDPCTSAEILRKRNNMMFV